MKIIKPDPFECYSDDEMEPVIEIQTPVGTLYMLLEEARELARSILEVTDAQ